ncbi:MAG TPA: 4'-phosphopantetheinyl transferase superfamily protein [Fluviicoccus sp.]|nr:4'-phosphopantetheinyl transferase superfamily protein [Fluviicoccus sp.]
MTHRLVVGLARHEGTRVDLARELAALPEPLRESAPPSRQEHRLAAYIASRRLLLETLKLLPSGCQPTDSASHLLRRGAGFPFWSVSHTQGMVACAWSTAGPCGVDLEKADRPVQAEKVIRRYFSAEEQAWLATLPERERKARFLDLWTRKEAVIKALGVGIAGHLAAIVFAPEQLNPVSIPAGHADEPPAVAVFRPEGDYLAVAWQGSSNVSLIRSGF